MVPLKRESSFSLHVDFSVIVIFNPLLDLVISYTKSHFFLIISLVVYPQFSCLKKAFKCAGHLREYGQELSPEQFGTSVEEIVSCYQVWECGHMLLLVPHSLENSVSVK